MTAVSIRGCCSSEWREGVITILSLLPLGILTFIQTHPQEDAAILLRYAKHLGEGYGLVWNTGELPVDGATDFLPVLMIAGLARVFGDVEGSSRVLAALAHSATILFLYFGLRRPIQKNRMPAFLAGLYLALGPGVAYILAGFATSIFALFATLTGYVFYRSFIYPLGYEEDSPIESPKSEGLAPILFGILSLVLGLTRPEGVFLSFFMMVSAFFWGPKDKAIRWLTYYMIFFILPGALFLIWRWHYFGHILPLPFLIRYGGFLHPESLKNAFENLGGLALPVLVGYGLSAFKAWKEKTLRVLIHHALVLTPVVMFLMMWGLISDEMNYLKRFQYVTLPLVLMGFPVIWAHVPRLVAMSLGTLMCCYPLLFGVIHLERYVPKTNPLYDVAVMLRQYKNYDYCMAVTEAGLIPFYSEWNVLDTWGLNDRRIAREGKVTTAYLDELRPVLVMFHEGPNMRLKKGGSVGAWEARWIAQIETLRAYAGSRGYQLAAVCETRPGDESHFYVLPGLPHSEEISQGIRTCSGKKGTIGFVRLR